MEKGKKRHEVYHLSYIMDGNRGEEQEQEQEKKKKKKKKRKKTRERQGTYTKRKQKWNGMEASRQCQINSLRPVKTPTLRRR